MRNHEIEIPQDDRVIQLFHDGVALLIVIIVEIIAPGNLALHEMDDNSTGSVLVDTNAPRSIIYFLPQPPSFKSMSWNTLSGSRSR